MRIMLCLTGDTFSAEFLSSFLRLEQWLRSKRIDYTISMAASSNIYTARNKSLGGAYENGPDQLPFNGQVYDYALLIDSDQTFTGDDLSYLLEHKVEVVGAAYRTQNVKISTCGTVEGFTDEVMRPAVPYTMEQLHYKDKNKLLEVDYLGFGFMLIKQGVLERIKFPWVSPVVKVGSLNNRECKDILSDDIGFCLALAWHNVPRYVDLRCNIKHLKQFAV